MMICVYCGDKANTLDHWRRPICVDFVKRPPAKQANAYGDTVPACHQCNAFLSALWIPSVPKRAEHLLKKYTYRKGITQERMMHLAMVSDHDPSIYVKPWADPDLWPDMPPEEIEETEEERRKAICEYNKMCKRLGRMTRGNQK